MSFAPLPASDGILLATTLPHSLWSPVPELATALAALAVPLCLWAWGRRERESVRRVHGLLALGGAATLALGWAAFAGPAEGTVAARLAMPVVAWAAVVA